MKMKVCRICGTEKSIDNFRKGKVCKKCENENNKKWNSANKEKMKAYQKQYYIEHINEIKEKRKNQWSNWSENNKHHLKEYRKNKSDLEKNKDKIRRTIRLSFRRKGFIKSKHTEEIVGISLIKFYEYLLQTFKNNYGYEWDGIEPIHIDHKRPLKYATTEEEVMRLCNYKNLQLLKAKDNLQKSSKINYELKGE